MLDSRNQILKNFLDFFCKQSDEPFIKNFTSTLRLLQRCNQNSVEYLRQSFLQKYFFPKSSILDVQLCSDPKIPENLLILFCAKEKELSPRPVLLPATWKGTEKVTSSQAFFCKFYKTFQSSCSLNTTRQQFLKEANMLFNEDSMGQC